MKNTFFKSTLFVALLCGTVALNTQCGKGGEENCSTPSTYNSNMKAIIDAKCVTCHKVGGTAEAIGVYSTYAGMQSNLEESWNQVDQGKMPKSGSPQLTDAEKTAWECWKNAGFPEN
jgi:cytochrome c553